MGRMGWGREVGEVDGYLVAADFDVVGDVLDDPALLLECELWPVRVKVPRLSDDLVTRAELDA